MVNPNMLINIAVIVLMGYIAIILLSSFQSVTSCNTLAGSKGSTLGTLSKACNAWFNNAGTLFLIGATLLLLLIIPMIRNVVGGGGGRGGGGY